MNSVTEKSFENFFEAPTHLSRAYAKANCRDREVCILSGVSSVPGNFVAQEGRLIYGVARALALLVWSMFKGLLCQKNACKNIGDNFFRAIDHLLAIPVVLASTIIKLIRCLLGALIHPTIAARA